MSFIEQWNATAYAVHSLAIAKGWHDKPRSEGDMIALIHSELSEALEGVRKPGPDRHCPEFSQVEVELADAVIRIMDWARRDGLKVAEAIIAKHEANKGRGYRHGNKAL